MPNPLHIRSTLQLTDVGQNHKDFVVDKAQPRYAWASPLSAVWIAPLSAPCVFYRRKCLSWAIHDHVHRTYIKYRESALNKVAEQYHNAHRE